MSRNQVIFYCIVGTILEWYDFALFGMLSAILANAFFPDQSGSKSLILTFAVFATGFIMRPLGSIVLGHVGDTLGRKKAVLISVSVMTVASLGFACLPTPPHTVWWVVTLFVFFRLLQGFSVGAENAGVVVFIGELTEKPRKLFVNQAWLNAVGNGGGVLLAISIADIVNNYNNLYPNGWRLAFIVGALIGVIGLRLRLKAIESPVFKNIERAHKIMRLPIAHCLPYCNASVLFMILLNTIISTVFFYVTIYRPIYLEHLGLAAHLANHLSLIGMIFLTLSIIATSFFVTLTNVLKWMTAATLLFFCVTIVSLILVSWMPTKFAIFTQMLYMLPIAILSFTATLYIALHFPPEVRYTGTTLCISIAMICGGITPLISQWLTDVTHYDSAPALFILVLTIVTLVILMFNHKKLVSQHAQIVTPININQL